MEKGQKLLDYLYGSGNLWGKTAPTAADYQEAISAGFLFEDTPDYSHEETLQRIRTVLKKISPRDVGNAFLYSLSTRQLQYRSALGSYYYALAIPAHDMIGTNFCELCNWWPVLKIPQLRRELDSYNVYNYERYKYGGIRHTEPGYALFDLEQFLRLPKVEPCKEDWQILKDLLHAMEELPPTKKAGAYRELITKKKLLKSNKSEVEQLLCILGICGILAGAQSPGYCDYFANVWQRAPMEHTNDYAYPVNHWHVANGVNESNFRKVFGVNYSDL